MIDDEFKSRLNDSCDQLYIENNIVKIKEPSVNDPMIKKIASILQWLINRKDMTWKYDEDGKIALKYIKNKEKKYCYNCGHELDEHIMGERCSFLWAGNVCDCKKYYIKESSI